MSVRLSRILLTIEAILLLLPVTIVSAVFAPVLIASSLRGNGSAELAAVTTIAVLALAVGWLLTLTFVFGNVKRFRKMGGMGLFFSSTGVILSLMGLGISLRDPGSELSIFVVGCPAVVVFAHLLAEWLCRSSGT